VGNGGREEPHARRTRLLKRSPKLDAATAAEPVSIPGSRCSSALLKP